MFGREPTFYVTTLILVVVLLLLTIPWWWFREITGDSVHARRRLLKWMRLRFSIPQLLGVISLLCAGLGLASLGSGGENLVGLSIAALLFGGVIFVMGSLMWYSCESVFQASLRDTSQRKPRPIQFSVVHLAGFTLVVGLTLAVFRMVSNTSDPAEAMFIIMCLFPLVLLAVLIGALLYAGAKGLFFGYGSGKRINRLRELEKDKEIRLPRRSNFSEGKDSRPRKGAEPRRGGMQ